MDQVETVAVNCFITNKKRFLHNLPPSDVVAFNVIQHWLVLSF